MYLIFNSIFFVVALLLMLYVIVLYRKKVKEKVEIEEKIKLHNSGIITFDEEKGKFLSEKKKLEEKNRKIWNMSEAVYKEKKKVDEENEKLIQEKGKLETEKKKFEGKNKKLWNQSIAIHKEKERIEVLKKEIEEKHYNVTSSIRYALRIQKAILPADDYFKILLPDSFIIYKPKDIVSGDFYWLGEDEGKILFAVVDCTGHGVPGAFMSMFGSSCLNQSLNEKNIKKPSEILSYLSQTVQKYLHHNIEGSIIRDGMDLSVCCYNKESNLLEYAGVHNSMYLLRKNEIKQFKADILPIGEISEEENQFYVNNEIKIESGDIVYLFSDGYLDQFGGKNNKKIGSKRFKELLLEYKDLEMSVQKEKIENYFLEWKGEFEQIDDVTVMGIRF